MRMQFASSKRLIPEMETSARITLDHPMTFELIMDALPLFEDSALHDLLDFRGRCRDNLLSFFVSFADGTDGAPKVWNKCHTIKSPCGDKSLISQWFHDLVYQYIKNCKSHTYLPITQFFNSSQGIQRGSQLSYLRNQVLLLLTVVFYGGSP